MNRWQLKAGAPQVDQRNHSRDNPTLSDAGRGEEERLCCLRVPP